jgi:carbon monoxide dehydrogenase subunit G
MKLENSFTINAPVEKAWQALNSPETVAPCFPGATLTDYEGDSFTGTVKVKLGPISMTYKGKGTYVSRDDAAHTVIINANGRDSRGNGTANATVTASLTADGPDKTAVSMATDMTITGKPAQFGRGVIADVADKIIGQFSACVARKLAPAAEEATEQAAVSERSVAANGAAPAPATGTPVTAAAAGTSAAGGAAAASGTSQVEAPTSTATAPDLATTAPVTPATTTVRSAAPLRSPVRSEVEAIDLLGTAGAPVLKRLAPVAAGGLLLLLVLLLVRRLRSA